MKTQDLRMIFGFCLLVMLTILAAIIAIGHVEQQTSYGLNFILGALSTLAGGFAQWAFTTRDSGGRAEDKNVGGDKSE